MSGHKQEPKKGPEKAELRGRIRAARRERLSADIDGSFRTLSGEAISSLVLSELNRLSPITSASIVAVYVSTESEPNTAILRADLRAKGVTVLIPRVAGESLEWCVDDDQFPLMESRWGIVEPTGPAVGSGAAPLLASSAIVVPALAIDASGFRLGQGGGFYDRALAELGSTDRPIMVGVIYDDEFIEAVPRETHDIQVDVIVTEKRVIAAVK
ncbi:MAG: 5-formyltetrahydrofolate cyclo-ligase [Candidatus Nanopelagicales bacterium]|nr:5-formyltetrahydrofolate cyclo-ligase [Candidatus Nanopelagicales bacterium]